MELLQIQWVFILSHVRSRSTTAAAVELDKTLLIFQTNEWCSAQQDCSSYLQKVVFPQKKV